MDLSNVPKGTKDVGMSGPCRMVKSPGNEPIKMAVHGGDAETRPVNAAMRWIMRGDNNADIPPGCIIPFRPSDKCREPDLPWLLCSGMQHSQQKYPDLYSIVGNRYLPPSTEPDDLYFRVPDLRGMFIRGADTGEKLDETHGDPDFENRVLFNGKLPQTWKQSVGTYQTYGTEVGSVSDWHVPIKFYPDTLPDKKGNRPIVKVNNISGNTNVEDGAYSTKQTWTGFALETRPNNVAYPHYIAGTAMSEASFPIGAIVASVSRDPIDDLEGPWSYCDGGGDTPQLVGLYIRSVDDRPRNMCPVPVWADPERPRGAGSTQVDCIGCPQGWKQFGTVKVDASGRKVSVELSPVLGEDERTATAGIAAKIPGNHRTNSMAGHSHEVCNWNGRVQTFPVKAKHSTTDGLYDWTYPTMPKSVFVNFFIKVH